MNVSMGKLFEFLSGPITGVIGAIGDVIDSLHVSDEEKMSAKLELVRVQNEFELAVMRADVEWAAHQADVIKTEAKSDHKLAAVWRPVLMLTFTYIIAHNYVIAPIAQAIWPEFPVVLIPADLWDLLKIGVGGYIVGRSAEKINKDRIVAAAPPAPAEIDL